MYQRLEEKLQHPFRHPELLNWALALNTQASLKLALLGDALLQTALYERYLSEYTTAQLSQLRAAVCSRQVQAEIVRGWVLDLALTTNAGSQLFEALIGAVFTDTDHDYAYTATLALKHLAAPVAREIAAHPSIYTHPAPGAQLALIAADTPPPAQQWTQKTIAITWAEAQARAHRCWYYVYRAGSRFSVADFATRLAQHIDDDMVVYTATPL